MEWSELIYFVLASMALTIAPGPDILYLLAKSLSDGAKSGVVFAAGLCSGLVFHTALIAVGVAAMVRQSPFLLQVLQCAGAAYLLYLAWKSLGESGALRLSAAGERQALWRLYRRGLLMNCFNPKVILFFLAFLPQFVRADAQSPGLQTVFLGAVFAAQAFCIFALTACLAGRIRQRILSQRNFSHYMGRVQAAVLCGISAFLLFQ